MGFGHSTFTINAHDDFVKVHGDVVLWRRGYKCPCGATPDSNRSLLSCMGCHGLGLIYDTPVPITGLVTGVTRDRTLMESGFAEPGDMLLGLAPDEPNFISEDDLVRITWNRGQPYEGDTIQRDQNVPDILFYEPHVVEKCFTIDPVSGIITPYFLGADFSLSGNLLQWNPGRGPASGAIYSIKYAAFYDWCVFFGPKDRFENAVNLGQRVMLRKRHLTKLPPLVTGAFPPPPPAQLPPGRTYPVFRGYTSIAPGEPGGPTGPDVEGDWYRNLTPAPGYPSGWTCVESGNPGVWKADAPTGDSI